MGVKDPETAQTAGFVWLFPSTFVSSVFTPVYTMPDWLQPIARNNPVTLVANLLRAVPGHAERQRVERHDHPGRRMDRRHHRRRRAAGGPPLPPG